MKKTFLLVALAVFLTVGCDRAPTAVRDSGSENAGETNAANDASTAGEAPAITAESDELDQADLLKEVDEAGFESAISENAIVLVDFTADW